MVIDAVPSVEMVRFVNSGMKHMAVLRLMRAFTEEIKLLDLTLLSWPCRYVFSKSRIRCSHSGFARFSRCSTDNNCYTYCSYNDLEAVKKLFSENPDAISIILEPIVGNAGFVTPEPGFLKD